MTETPFGIDELEELFVLFKVSDWHIIFIGHTLLHCHFQQLTRCHGNTLEWFTSQSRFCLLWTRKARAAALAAKPVLNMR